MRYATRFALVSLRVPPNHLFAAALPCETIPGACRTRWNEPLVGPKLDSRSRPVDRTVAASRYSSSSLWTFVCRFGPLPRHRPGRFRMPFPCANLSPTARTPAASVHAAGSNIRT